MKKYAFTFTGQEQFDAPISKHDFLLRCMPGTYAFQRSYAHKLSLHPHAALTETRDAFGNTMYTGAVDKKHTRFSFQASGFVLCSKYLTHEPLDRLYLYPTQFTRPTESIDRLLPQASLSKDPWNRAMQLCRLCHRLITYVPESDATTAAEALAQGKGDAKDMSHVLILLCRRSGIAARMVSGLAMGISRAHYWTEVYCGGVWRGLDPTTGLPIEDGYLKIAHAPDYKFCVLFRGVWREEGRSRSLQMEVQVTEHVVTTRNPVPRG